MKLTPINSTNRIFHIENIFPELLVDDVLKLDWNSFSWQRGESQESWSRRSIQSDQHPALQNISTYIWDHLDKIEDICQVKFHGRYPSTVWWYDEPGFDVSLHTDGHLPSTMQLFWLAPSEEFATQFYEFKDTNTPISDLKFVPNTGYFMLNMPNTDGSQPLHWHAMLNKVPNNTFRITSYTTFGTYENK